MLRSMTGYGRGEASSGDVTVVVELRSVNNRFRDIQLRCPREYLALEPRINNVLRDPLTRGRVDAFVRREVTGGKSRVVADRRLAMEYATVINDLCESMVGFVDREVPVTFILSQAGVLQIVEDEVDVLREWPVVEVALQSAVNDLQEMRDKEGRALYQDLLGYVAEVRGIVAEVEAANAGIAERLQKRLEARLRRLIGDRVDDDRLAQEAAVLADKSDVAEEITRLRSHCDQFASALDDSEAVGRRLDFLLQEMNREVNTIGSKAAEHPVSHRVVTLKSVLERMREQSANVE
jgi:uncharacterized protein (TIGR00255 family)